MASLVDDVEADAWERKVFRDFFEGSSGKKVSGVPSSDIPETFFTDQRREEKEVILASMSSRVCLTVGELSLQF